MATSRVNVGMAGAPVAPFRSPPGMAIDWNSSPAAVKVSTGRSFSSKIRRTPLRSSEVTSMTGGRGSTWSVAAENKRQAGYVTEKLLHSLWHGTVPVYWGAPDVCLDFNPDAFLTVDDSNDIPRTVAMLDRDRWDERKSTILDEDRALSEELLLKGIPHYSIRYSHVMGVHSDFVLKERERLQRFASAQSLSYTLD